jgi:hypothetical protein
VKGAVRSATRSTLPAHHSAVDTSASHIAGRAAAVAAATLPALLAWNVSPSPTFLN